MLTLSEIAAGFDPGTGNLALSLPLGALTDAIGPGYGLEAAYSSVLGDSATISNMAAPTGILGLGWDLNLPRIYAASDPDSLTEGLRYYLVQGGSVCDLIPLGAGAHGQQEFGTSTALFWVIRYDASAESWTLIDEEGMRWTYGGTQNAIETAIGWGNWTGPTSEVQGQRSLAVGWRLSRVTDLWNHAAALTYEQDTGTVGIGDQTFTRAIRLKRVTGAGGGRIDLAYEDKTADEYIPAHQNPPAPNAWQDMYDTKALSSVTVSATGGAVLDKVELGYGFLGSGTLKKRILTSIRQAVPGGPRPPGVNMTYQDAAGIDYGRVISIVTPLGGTAAISYTSVTPAFGDRSLTLAAPGGGAYEAPDLLFEDRFTVAVWAMTDKSGATVSAYTWDGRWVPVSLDTLTTTAAAPSVDIAGAGQAFAAQSASELYAYRQNPRMAGAWTASSKTTLNLGAPSATGLACTDTAVAVLGLDTAKLQALVWNGSAWTAPAVSTLSGGAADPIGSIDASGDEIIAVIADKVDSAQGITVHRLSATGAAGWTAVDNTLPRAEGPLSSVAVKAGIGFAVITQTSLSGSNLRASYTIVDWLDPATPFRTTTLSRLHLDPSDVVPDVQIHGSTIALGELLARFDGGSWTLQSIKSDLPSGAAALQAISYAADQVARLYTASAGGLVSDIVSYDPDAGSETPWSEAVRVECDAGALTARASLAGNFSSRYAVLPYVAPGAPANTVTNAVYYLGPDMNWAFASSIPDPIAANDLSTLRVVGDQYIVYQSGSDTYAYPLKNGAIDTANKTQISGTLVNSSAAPARLIGQNGFATYTGTLGSSAVVTLHRATPSGASGAAEAVVIDKIRQLPGNTTDTTTGYPVIDAIPIYEAVSAVQGPAEGCAHFNRVGVAVQSASGTGSGTTQFEMFNGLTSAEAGSLPAADQPDYPAASATNPSDYTRWLAGTRYRHILKWVDDGGSPQQDSFASTFSVTERKFLTGDYEPVGMYSREVQTNSVADGVSAEMTTQYNANGFPTHSTATQFDSEGQTQSREIETTYFADVYTASAPENLLAPIVQTISKTNGTATDAQVTTWSSDWGTEVADWAPLADFSASAADFATFDAWTDGSTPSGWRRNSVSLARNQAGGEILSQDILGRRSTNLYDDEQTRIVARFGAAAINEVSYYGLEPYESTGAWSYLGSNSIRGHITSAQYHTGSRSLELAASTAGDAFGPIASFSNLGARQYIFSCWMLTPTGFAPDPATTRWRLQAYTQAATPQAVGDAVNIEFPAPSANKWAYIEGVIDLPAIRAAAGLDANTPLTVTVSGTNAVGTGPSVYADELRFSPLDAVYSAVVFDPASGLMTTRLGENGETRRIIRDGAHRTVATVGPRDNNIGSITALAFARSLSGDADAFNPILPNQVLEVRSSSFGGYQDFDPSDIADWTLASGWTIADRALSFSGSSSDPIGSEATLTDFATSNYAVRVRASNNDPATASMSIGTGDLFVTWLPASGGTWALREADGSGGWTTLAERAGAFGQEWLFAIVDEVAFFFADGDQIFGDLLGTPVQGKLILAATGNCAFQEMVIAIDPQLTMSFLDGSGQTVQSMSIVDRQTAHIAGVLLDDLGRPTVQREPVRQTVAIGSGSSGPPAIADRAEGGLTTYLPDKTNGEQMTIAEYLTPAISNAPYDQQRLEASPMARPVEIAGPGADQAMGTGHTAKLSYGSNSASSWLNSILPSGAPGRAAGSYFINGVTDPNGNLVETALSKDGETVAQAFTPSGGSTPTRLESYHYDGAGRLIETRLPNYYAPPPDAVDGTPWTRTATYDFVGNTTGTNDPNTGAASFLYDQADRLRFTMDAAGAAQTPEQIRYTRYDTLDRVIEEGIVSKTGLSWADLAAHVDDQSWPTAADGAIWSKKFQYDRPAGATDQAPNQVGLLVAVTFNRSGTATPAASEIDTEAYAYDTSGNVVTQTSTHPGFDASVRQTEYAWDNFNRTIKIVYPRTLDPVSGAPQGTAVDVTYFYDRLGRLATVGQGADGTEVVDPSNPNPGPEARYVRNEYDPRGMLATQVLGINSGGPINRAYDYDIVGRPVSIGGDFVNESLTYTTGGLGGGTDYNGRIASTTVAYTSQRGAANDLGSGAIGAARTWQYDYRPEGWLAGAVASDAGSNASNTAGTATSPITYDANGTLLTVPRSPATETYSYLNASTGKRDADRVTSKTTQVAQTVDLSDGKLPAGWSHAASNGGRSLTQIVSGASGDVPDYVQLRGGTASYHETLQFTGAFEPSGSYTVAFKWRSDADLADQSGPAGLYAVLIGAHGEIERIAIADFAAGASSWTSKTATLDLAAISAGLAVPPAEIINIRLEFLNAKIGAGGAAGGAIDIGEIALATVTSAPVVYTYDPSGRMTRNPERDLSVIGYEPLSGKIDALTMTADAPLSSAAFQYGLNDAMTLAVETWRDGTVEKTLAIYTPGGERLATYHEVAGGTPEVAFQIPGRSQPVGQLPNAGADAAQYYLRDHLGSVRVLAQEGDDPGNGLCATFDYGPFGEVTAFGGADANPPEFANQPIQPASGFTHFPARSYDPRLRTFTAPDAALQTPWPYSYVGGDPVNRTDPSGDRFAGIGGFLMHPYTRLAVFAAVIAPATFDLIYTSVTRLWDNPKAAMADAAETVVGMAIVPPATVLLTSCWLLSPLLRNYANLVHLNNRHKRIVPVVSITMGIGSGMYQAASLSAVRDLSGKYIRETNNKTISEIAYDAGSEALDAAFPSTVGTLYQHFYAPPLNFFGTGGRKDGPKFKRMDKAPHNEFFLRADGFYAFEEYIEHITWIPGPLEKGNVDMKGDTNFGLMIARPLDYFGAFGRPKMYYRNTAFKATNLVLEHRDIFGYCLFVTHPHHTPGKGGPGHTGISTFIKRGLRFQYLGFLTARGAVSEINRKYVNATLIMDYAGQACAALPIGNKEDL